MAMTPRDLYVRPGTSIPRTWWPQWRKVGSPPEVIRTGATGKSAFQACIRLSGTPFNAGALKYKRPTFFLRSKSGWSATCAHGKNPREALRLMFASAARKITTRTGAFAGLAGYSKSNRKARRTRRASKRS